MHCSTDQIKKINFFKLRPVIKTHKERTYVNFVLVKHLEENVCKEIKLVSYRQFAVSGN